MGTEKRRGRPTVSEEKVVKAVTLSQIFSLTTYQNTTYQAIRIHILIRSLGDWYYTTVLELLRVRVSKIYKN